MIRKILTNKFLTLTVMSLTFASMTAPAYAWGGHGGYRYHGGRWYNDGWFWAGAGLTALAVGATIASLPPSYSTVYVGGVPYYYSGGTYFVAGPAGYVAVAPPAAAPAMVVSPPPVMTPVSPSSLPQASPAEASGNFDVYVPNSNGSYTLVTLKKADKGYLGPQGEFYPEHPTVEKLKVLYGK